MINHPVFSVDTAANYVEFTRKQLEGRLVSYFIQHWRGAFIALAIRRSEVVNPLETRYRSMSPYLFGDRATPSGNF